MLVSKPTRGLLNMMHGPHRVTYFPNLFIHLSDAHVLYAYDADLLYLCEPPVIELIVSKYQ